MNQPSITSGVLVLGIDGSTDVTGLALLHASLSGRPVLLGTASCHAGANHPDSFTRRIARIRETAADITSWLSRFDPVGVCGFEMPYYSPTTKNNVSDALMMANGAYLSLMPPDVRIYPIQAITAKAVYGAANRKRDEAKKMAMDWAVAEFKVQELATDSREAIADALAVAVATVAKWREDQHIQNSLFGKAAGKVKAVK